MDGEEQKICPNCKREIPAVNFTIHTVHCARNIKMCPVCKEPVPQADLEEHHEKLHKLMPCKQCGEKVCGTDLEDHIRDSCGHTIKSCRFCELELRRRELPAHEGYCGVRTEQCPECREWVMIKCRQLHLDSNHGFLRLDDDPVPQPKKDPAKISNLVSAANLSRPSTAGIQRPSTSNIQQSNSQATSNPMPVKNTNLERPRTEIRFFNNPSSSRGSFLDGPSASGSNGVNKRDNIRTTPNVFESCTSDNGDLSSSVSRQNNSNVSNGVTRIPHKRNNDKPQINTSTVNKVVKDKAPPVGSGGGAVKKRPAPPPPAAAPPDPRRDRALRSAIQRQHEEERQRNEQNAYNLAHGLPPVLSPAAKLDKLRKMDALHNRESEAVDYKSKLQGRVWMDHSNVPIGNVLGSNTNREQDSGHLEAETRRRNKNENRSRNSDNGDDVRDEFRDVKPMTPEQFMDRFRELQVRKDNDNPNERRGDRFSEIKSSLRELRRGLNEVTAPYNSNNVSAPNNRDRPRRVSPIPVSSPDVESELRLPCEFCGAPVLAHDLVLHQTGCRPDLAQYRGSARCESQSEAAAAVPVGVGEPVIPCEFCTESLPVYLIVDHQERCGREANLLYPD